MMRPRRSSACAWTAKRPNCWAYRAGTVFSTLQDVLASYYINDFTLSGNNFEVKLQAGADSRSSLHHVEELLIPNSNGDMVPLSRSGHAPV